MVVADMAAIDTIIWGDAKSRICPICYETFIGMGNNAEPVADGRCCDDCNRNVVIRIRLARLKAQG